MIFNPDLSEKAQEVIFCRKAKKRLQPNISFNNIPLKSSMFQKQLGLTLYEKLNLVEHTKNITFKISKTIKLVKLALYKTFIRSQ